MIAATLFSGIGAPECSMPHWDWIWCAEIEKHPSAVLQAHNAKSVNLGDVNAKDFVARAKAVGRPDVLVFGSPCQDFSVAGRRVGMDGSRGNLALVALGIVAELRPRWMVFENVPGLLSSYSGGAEAERALQDRAESGQGLGDEIDCDEDSDFAAFLSLVQQCGYLGCYRITDAQFAGVPQRRRRIFAVFHLGDWRPAAAILLERASLRGDHPPRREEGKGIAGTFSSRPSASGGFGTDFDLDGGLDESSVEGGIAKALRAASGGIDREDGHTLIDDQGPRMPDGPVGSVSSKWSKGRGGPAGDECYNLVAFNGRQDPDVYGDRTGPLDTDPGTQVIAFDTTQIAFQTRIARNGRGQPEEIVPALNGSDAGETSDMRPMIAVFKPSHYTRGKDGAPSGGETPLGAEPDNGDQEPVLLSSTAVRRLTPIECERLQAFPDGYTDVPFGGRNFCADGPRYRSLGNAMNVKEIGAVLERIERFEKLRDGLVYGDKNP